VVEVASGWTRVDLNRGDIYFVSLDPSLGHEQRGYRPVLVLTREAYNTLTGAPLIAAITNGGAFATRNGFSVSLDGKGLSTTGIVRCDQVRTLDLRERSARYVESVPADLLEEVLDRLATILE
jgi:mRNA-degrading endonuclease toxin of MazEF toxin-antitoxin module